MLCLESRSEKRKKNIFTLRLRLGLAGTHFISRLKCNKVAFNVLEATVMREEVFDRLGSATVGEVVVNAGRWVEFVGFVTDNSEFCLSSKFSSSLRL